MSFTTELSHELISAQIKKTCCRKAAALGVFCGARKQKDTEGYVSYFYDEETALFAKELLWRTFHSESGLEKIVRVGRDTYVLSFSSSGISEFFRRVDRGVTPEYIASIFKCPSCQNDFLRGVFLGCGSITDPRKAYHMELSFPTAERADMVSNVVGEIIGAPKKIKRGDRYAIYYKNNGAILDFLYCIGSSHSSLYMANSYIERDIRNNENRATNCVARNISRSVGAAQKQISAIEKLIETRKIESLPDELRATAKLRIENTSASLSELALMHEPPISKSGLNGRLKKLMEAAEALDTVSPEI